MSRPDMLFHGLYGLFVSAVSLAKGDILGASLIRALTPSPTGSLTDGARDLFIVSHGSPEG
jgi:hypothetical protein